MTAAINIGCQFLAGVMRRDLGPWTRWKKGKNGGTDDQRESRKRRKNHNNTHTNTNGNGPTTTPLEGWAHVFRLKDEGKTMVLRVFHVPRCQEDKSQKRMKVTSATTYT